MSDGTRLAGQLNQDAGSASIDRIALDQALRACGEDFLARVNQQCPNLFADVPYFISTEQLGWMQAIIAAVERVVRLPGWEKLHGDNMASPDIRADYGKALGVFIGYDFHLDADGAHLIEINTNAGGAFLNALLSRSQAHVAMPGKAATPPDVEKIFLEMFASEWRLQRGDAALRSIAIIDELPQSQFLYPEFVLAQRMFEQAGIIALIADPDELEVSGQGVYCAGHRIDLIYNRLTDFSLRQHPRLLQACLNDRMVLTPGPGAYLRYADKRNLARLTDAESLRSLAAQEEDIATLQLGIPQTRLVRKEASERWWAERKQWFFKPASGYGSKGTYKGAGLTHRVFDEIVNGDYVAQKISPPSERQVGMDQGKSEAMKVDVRCYVYAGDIQLVVSRLYQGQTTNFRTPRGGFAQIRIVG